MNKKRVLFQLFTVIFLAFISLSCGKKDEPVNGRSSTEGNNKTHFNWSEKISKDDIPNFPVRGMLNGKEFNIQYVNFEYWRGSEDHVLNFSNKSPKQNCGYIEGNDAIHLMRKSGDLKEGDIIKENFSSSLDGFITDYHFTTASGDMQRETPSWNCALVITEKNEKTVKGRIAVCFNDAAKSWIAGTFEAVRCHN